MNRIKIGDKIKIKNGDYATIISEFGSGGQGTVYKVKYQSSDYALKWYHSGVFKDPDGFYKNLERNVIKGAPTKEFLWPKYVTEKTNESFGYIMDVRSPGYSELTDFFVGSRKKPQVKFSSLRACFKAAINIVNGFDALHSNGYSYQDINNGNFFINKDTGDVLICDNDNVAPYGKSYGIMGKQRWMAPEIVTGGTPNAHSDRFSLSVVLFRLLFINHPLEGRYSTPPCMTKTLERKYYGTDPIFIMDPNDSQNRPIPGTDSNITLLWGAYPQFVRDIFIKAFSKQVMSLEKPRVLEKDWLKVFFRLLAETAICPFCHSETFFESSEKTGLFSKRYKTSCINCGKSFGIIGFIRCKSFDVPVFKGQVLYKYQIDPSSNDIETIIARIVSNPKDHSLMGLQNLSKETWKVRLPDQSERVLEEGKVVPLKNGFIIDSLNNEKTAIKVIL